MIDPLPHWAVSVPQLGKLFLHGDVCVYNYPPSPLITWFSPHLPCLSECQNPVNRCVFWCRLLSNLLPPRATPGSHKPQEPRSPRRCSRTRPLPPPWLVSGRTTCRNRHGYGSFVYAIPPRLVTEVRNSQEQPLPHHLMFAGRHPHIRVQAHAKISKARIA